MSAVLRDAPFAPELVLIPPGEFLRAGCPDGKPPRTASIEHAFAIGRYAATFDGFDFYCIDADLPLQQDEGWGRGNLPVINVSWNDAQAYAVWLSA